jgi:hypothetical protein
MQNGRIKALSWFCAGLAMVAAAIVVYCLGGIITLLPAPLTQIRSMVQLRGKPLIRLMVVLERCRRHGFGCGSRLLSDVFVDFASACLLL